MSRPTGKPEPDFGELAREFLAEIANDFPEDLETVIEWLARLSRSKDPLHELTKYRFPVVGVRKFIEDPSYMNAPKVLWPRVMRELEELCSGRYVESVMTGGIGCAKTTLALYCQAYQLYLMSCLRNPHEEFSLDPASEIVIVFQSLNASLAKSVDYERFRAMIASAPYFKRHFRFDEGMLSQMRFPRRIIVKPVSGQETGAIGQNCIGGIIDEVDWMAVVENSKSTRDGSVYDQAVQNYNAIARRRESRFMQLGELPGMLCLVSSKNYPGGLTDRKQAEARLNKRIFVYDKRLWDIDPDRFCGDKFRVFVGDETRKPRILREDEIAPERDEPLVVAVPVEYERQFNNDLVKSIRDIAGYSTQALHPFILNTDAVAECFGNVPSIASREDCDFEHTKLQLFPKRIQNPGEPRFAHVDLSISKDSAGVCVGHIPGFKHMNRGDFQETLPIIQYDMILEVRPPKGGEIEFENIRRLLYVMRDKLMVPIKWVSFDSFQSTDSMQILAQQGFIVGYQCVAGDTRVWSDRGFLPAHEIAVGDHVQSRVGARKVTNKWAFGKKPCLRVTTDDGHTLVVTHGHKLEADVNPSGQFPKWGWVQASDLFAGQRIRAWSREADVDASTLYPLKEVFGANNALYKKLPRVLTEGFAEFLGLVWGDGNIDRDGVRLAVAPGEAPCAERIMRKALCTDVFSRAYEDRRCVKLGVNSRTLVHWLRINGLTKSDQIPEAIWRSPKRVQAAFIRGLFSTDGHVKKRDGACVLSTKHPAWATYVQDALRSLFGIPSTLVRNRRLPGSGYATDSEEQFLVSVRGPRARFSDLIGFCYSVKREELNRHLACKGRSVFTRVQSVIEDAAEVFDFEVDEDHAYVANGLVSHNSMDVDTAAYDLTKQALYDRRILAPAHKKVQFELCTLEFDAKKRKIDHKPQGSKDVSDALAGVAIGLTMRRELWLRHNVPTSRIPESLNKITSKHSVTAKEQDPPKRYMDAVREARGVAPVAEVRDE